MYYGGKIGLEHGDSAKLRHVSSNITRKHCRKSALLTAAHILVCLTQEHKSMYDIASADFDSNLELVSVWADYMVGLNWIFHDGQNKLVSTDSGNRWLQKVMSPYLHDDK